VPRPDIALPLSDADEEDYIDDLQVRLHDQEGTAMEAVDFGDEHVQRTLNRQMPSNITGIDTGQRPDVGRSLV
jgi:hypothetical protein